MKIGLKLWSVNVELIETANALLDDGVCDYLELYVVPSSVGNLNEWSAFDGGVVLHAAHSHGGLNMAEPNVFNNRIELFEELDAFRRDLKADKVIFHPGVNGRIEDSIENFQSMAHHIPLLGKSAIVENKPLRGLNGERCVGSTPEEMELIMKATGFEICLDFGHAIAASNSLNRPWRKHVEEFMALQPSLFHLSDGDIDAEMDSHLNFGEGSYPIAEIAAMLADDARVTIETEKAPDRELKDFAEDAYFLLAAGFGLRKDFSLRPALPDDSRAVWEMANSPDVRAASFSSEPILWETHERWFRSKLNDGTTLFLLVADRKGDIAGQLRFELKNDQWTISISVKREFRGKGLGTELIKIGSMILFDRRPNATRILAYIRKENTASKRSFEKAGYRFLGVTTVNEENDAVLMELDPRSGDCE